MKDCPTKQSDFTEENIRNYFQTYGTIVNFVLLDNNRCVIEYNDYGNDLFPLFNQNKNLLLIRLDAVDCILLDSPHYFNSNEVLIEKYYSTEHIHQLERMLLSNPKTPLPGVGDDEEHVEFYTRSYRHLNMRIRLLNDSIASVKLSNEIRLEKIAKGFQSTIERRKNLLEQIQHLTEQCQILEQRNQTFKQTNEIRIQDNEILENNYRKEIVDQDNQQIVWKNKLDLLRS